MKELLFSEGVPESGQYFLPVLSFFFYCLSPSVIIHSILDVKRMNQSEVPIL